MNKIEVYNRKANGKLLLTSEYFVLDGAEALAVPTKFGQKMVVSDAEIFSWTSYNNKNEIWLKDSVSNSKFKTESLNQLFNFLNTENVELIDTFHFDTYLDFPNEWGLGSSSTFVALISDFYNVNPYKLNKELFKGSGYDIACAFAKKPILFSKQYEFQPHIQEVEISESVKPYLYFLYLGKKQNSREGIEHYRSIKNDKNTTIERLNNLTSEIVKSSDYMEWIRLMSDHEELISSTLKLDKISNAMLNGLPYFTKSLGSWGGDFVLLISDEEEKTIRKNIEKIGLNTLFNYNDLILS